MCARITLLSREEVAEVLESLRSGRSLRLLATDETAPGRAQARVGGHAPVVVERKKELALEELGWGIEAPWNGKLVFNTRLESALAGRGMWKDAIATNRCIVPVATFFETHASEVEPSPRTRRPVKRAYEFASEEDEPLLLASVRIQDRFSVVTTQPNDSVAPVHPRMPLVLRFQEAPLWMEGELADLAQLADRADVRLTANPERHQPPETEQLSLF